MKKLLTNFIIYKLIFVIFLTYGIFEILYSLRQILANIFSSTTVPIVGTFNNPAPFAIILSIVAPLSWYYIINKLWKFKVNDIIDNIISILSILFFISMPIALYMSQSRTGWLATIISCSIITLLKLFEYPNWRHYCSIFLSFIIVALCLLSVPAYKIKQNSADGRLLIWKISTSIIKEHPVFGISEGNFSGNYGYAQAKYFESGKGTDKEKMLAGSPKYAYNEYIQIAVQLGIAGLLIFTTILSYCFYNLSKSTISESNAIIGMLTSLLIVMGFSYPLRIFETCIISCFIIISALLFPRTLTLKIQKNILPTILICASFIFLCSEFHKFGNNREALRQWNLISSLTNSKSPDILCNLMTPLFPYLSKNPEFLFEYGKCLSEAKKYNESNIVLLNGTKFCADPMFFNIMGENYISLNNYDMAENMFLSAYYRIPHKKYPIYLLMLLYEATGQNDLVQKMSKHILNTPDKVHSIETEFIKNEAKSRLQKYSNYVLPK